MVGNLFWLWCIIVSVSLQAAQIELRTTSLRGTPLSKVAANTPFYVEVIAYNTDGRVGKPTIEGSEPFVVHGQKNSMQFMNGQATVINAYQGVISTPGTYTLGPASLKIGTQTVESNTTTITVTPEQNKSATIASENKSPTLIARLSISKSSAVVGEKIVCVLRCLVRDEEFTLSHVDSLKCPGCRIIAPREALQTVETIDGVEYIVTEWQWDLYPEKAGKIQIPALRVEATEQSAVASVLSLFAYQRAKPIRTYSNSIDLQVAELPPHDPPISLIGIITNISAQCTPTVARQGEGMTLALRLEGDANWDVLDSFPIQRIPAELKIYPSCRRVESGSKNTTRVIFEYVVQGMQSGNWQIPSQKCEYFDVQRGCYKIARTEPIEITIVKAAEQENTTPPTTTENKTTVSEVPPEQDEIRPGKYDARFDYTLGFLPWWIYIFCLWIPTLMIYGTEHYRGLQQLFGKPNDTEKKHIFKLTYDKLYEIQATHNYHQLYGMFIELFTHLDDDNIPTSQDSIDYYLKHQGMPEKQREAWNIFFTKIAEYQFGKLANISVDDDIIHQSRYWIEVIERVV